MLHDGYSSGDSVLVDIISTETKYDYFSEDSIALDETEREIFVLMKMLGNGMINTSKIFKEFKARKEP